MKTHVIDAKGKVLGRLATKVATLLRGKHKVDFMNHKDIGDVVIIKNVEKIVVTGKKEEKKKYRHHSGYIGGLKEETYKEVFKKDPSKVFRKAVYGMLPKNRLRRKQIKRLKFE
jgi:large subunit ribosomal protein L13